VRHNTIYILINGVKPPCTQEQWILYELTRYGFRH